MLNKGLWKFPVCSRSVKSDSAVELHVQKPYYLGGKCTRSFHPLHCGIDLDTPLVPGLTLFHLPAKHLIPPNTHLLSQIHFSILHMFTFSLLPPPSPLPLPSLSRLISHLRPFMYIYSYAHQHISPSLCLHHGLPPPYSLLP